MRLCKRLGALACAVLFSVVALSAAHAQSNKNKSSILPLIAPFGVVAAAGSAGGSVSWFTIVHHQWTFPWKGFIGGPNTFVPQTVNAGVQHISNVVNPNLFNETFTSTGNPFKTGQHTVGADSKQTHTRSSKSGMGQVIVGWIICGAGNLIGNSLEIDKKEKRQMTPREAGRNMCGIPNPNLFLPEDNPAVYKIAKEAWEYANSPEGRDEGRYRGGIYDAKMAAFGARYAAAYFPKKP